MRDGTRKSRAPSGLEAVRMGVAELEKARLHHLLAHGGNDLIALHDVGVQRLAAQIEEAVFEAQIFGVVGLAEHRQRQFGGLRQHLDAAGENLDLAGGEIGVEGIGGAVADLAVDADHPFGPHLFSRGEGGAIGIGDDLGDAVMIAQVDEQQAAMVPHPMHPARQAGAGADLRRGSGPRRCGFGRRAWNVLARNQESPSTGGL